MSDYGPAFEFLDSRLDSRWTEGKYRTPAGSSLLLGSLVVVDTAAPGFLKQAPLNTPIEAKWAGLLLQELSFENSVFGPDPAGMDTYSYGVAKPGKLALITCGSGVKIRVKNIAGATRSDGRVIAAKTMYATTGTLATGDAVGWDGTKFLKVGQGSVTVAVARAVSVTSAGLELAFNA